MGSASFIITVDYRSLEVYALLRKHADPVVVVSFGGQYAHMIARRLRDLKAYTEVIPYTRVVREGVDVLAKSSAIVLSGGPASVNSFHTSVDAFAKLLTLGKPVLGICFGHQLLAKLLGGEVSEGVGEYGRTEVELVGRDPLFEGWGSVEEVWMSHKDYVTSLPESAEVLAVSGRGYIAAFRVKGKPIYGVQFHPEVKHTPKGTELLANFLEVAGVSRDWNPGDLIEDFTHEVREAVKPPFKAIVAVSGGVDSTVAAAIAKKALGERLVAVLVDHGLFREGEVDEVLTYLRDAGLNPILIDARERFLKRLEGVRDCEERRRIIGEEFARIFLEYASRDPHIKYLIQGTTYPDIIESGAEE
ncbi:MAG: glutamine-hydrolyzing GMP synthase, partial [Desulfurococcales archaeon]|nr:glutamine-hydrolyzing GMP synthase [Desulfurococcales archaeon]